MLASKDPTLPKDTDFSVDTQGPDLPSGALTDQTRAGLLSLQLYIAESSAHWGRYNAQLLANFGLLAAMVIGASGAFVHAHLHVVTIIGADMSAVWLLFTMQSARRLSLLSRPLNGLSDLTTPAAEQRTTRMSGGSLWQRNSSNLNRLSWSLPTLAVCGWILLFLSKPSI